MSERAGEQTNLPGSIRGMNKTLVRLMDGDVERARAEVEALVEQPELLEAWADRIYRESVERDIEAERRTFQTMIEANAEKEKGQIWGFNYDWLSKFQQTEREGLAQTDPMRIDNLPGRMKATALAGLAVAYLVDRLQREAAANESDSGEYEDVEL